MTGDQSSTDTLKETGSYPGGTVHRTHKTIAYSSSHQVGAHLTFNYDQTVTSHTETQTQDGLINPVSGEYSLTIVSTGTSTIVSQIEHNQTMSATVTGGSSFSTTTRKTGNNDSGGYITEAQSTDVSGQTRDETNQTR